MKFLSESLGEVTIRFQYFYSDQERERAAKLVRRRLTADIIEDLVYSIKNHDTTHDGIETILWALNFQPEPDQTKCIVEFNGLELAGTALRNPEDRCYKPVARATALEAALAGVPRDIKIELHELWRSRPGLNGKPVNRT